MTSIVSSSRVNRCAWGFTFAALAVLGLASAGSAQTLKTIVSFNLTDGATPGSGSLIADANGDLFGTTTQGDFLGNVYEVVNSGGVYASTSTVLFDIDASFYNLSNPSSGLVADAGGNLFFTTDNRNGYGPFGGTLLELAKTASGYASTPITLLNFDNPIYGQNVSGDLIVDSKGNLFGTAAIDGPGLWGTVYELAKTSSGYASAPTVLASFSNGNDGGLPESGVVADSNGNLFGTTLQSGAGGVGTVFEIVKISNGYATTPTTLVSFSGPDGAYPVGGLLIDAQGNLFGTTSQGGGTANAGTVFEIPKTSTGYATSPTTLASFDGSIGAYPTGGLIADANGSLFGTTENGGSAGLGTVFEIVKTSAGYASTPLPLINFDGIGSDGAQPLAGLIADANGNLFGTTQAGGDDGAYGVDQGTVFEVTGSGFVPPQRFAGTPGDPNCQGASISALAHTYGGIAHAAPGLGYSSVSALKNAIANYCAQ